MLKSRICSTVSAPTTCDVSILVLVRASTLFSLVKTPAPSTPREDVVSHSQAFVRRQTTTTTMLTVYPLEPALEKKKVDNRLMKIVAIFHQLTIDRSFVVVSMLSFFRCCSFYLSSRSKMWDSLLLSILLSWLNCFTCLASVVCDCLLSVCSCASHSPALTTNQSELI